jgi:hypothetical protein
MSVQNFFNSKQPLVKHENYIGNTADLITLKAERDDAWLDRQILWLLVRANNRVLSVSPLPPPLVTTDYAVLLLTVYSCTV